MIHTRFVRTAALLAGVGLAGCAIGTQRFGRPVDAALIPSIEVGRSTKADVLRTFGPPTSYSTLPVVPLSADAASEGERLAPEQQHAMRVFLYEYREDRENFFTMLLFTRFRREVLSDRLVFFFGDDDVVRYAAYARQTSDGSD